MIVITFDPIFYAPCETGVKQFGEITTLIYGTLHIHLFC